MRFPPNSFERRLTKEWAIGGNVYPTERSNHLMNLEYLVLETSDGHWLFVHLFCLPKNISMPSTVFGGPVNGGRSAPINGGRCAFGGCQIDRWNTSDGHLGRRMTLAQIGGLFGKNSSVPETSTLGGDVIDVQNASLDNN